MSNHPTQTERDDYLVVENALSSDLAACLTERLESVIQMRRALYERGEPHHGRTQIDGANTRIFHILEDDPVFAELIDHPPIVSYIKALLNENPHFHASDTYLEVEPTSDRGPGWHIDGHDSGYRGLRPDIPHLQLKIAYFLSDMTDPDQGNLMLVPGSHRANEDPLPDRRAAFDTMTDAVQVCVSAGTAEMFHNSVWRTRRPFTREGGRTDHALLRIRASVDACARRAFQLFAHLLRPSIHRAASLLPQLRFREGLAETRGTL